MAYGWQSARPYFPLANVFCRALNASTRCVTVLPYEDAADANWRNWFLSFCRPGAANDVSSEFMMANREFRSDLHVQGAFLALDMKTGRYTAMIGGREVQGSDTVQPLDDGKTPAWLRR
ncbi:MAG: hypothetical protein U1F16_08210 [Turneriella sp.]